MPRRFRRATFWTVALSCAFAFRLAYGLASTFWTEDERQIYLIGLASFARRQWPFFGADVVWTAGRLPGALQAWLVRAPLAIWHAPEAPFVLLNLLSFGALALFAWYCRRRLPELPAWFVWATLLLLPWTMNFSTHVVNTSYILPGAIVFFVGFFEAEPAFRLGALPRPLAWAMVGGGVAFLAQIHMSWVLVPPYAALAAVDTFRRERRALLPSLAGALGGAVVAGSLLAPTLLRDGLGAGGVGRTVAFHFQPPQDFVAIVARFLSFPAFEITRFIGLDTAERLLFLWREPWVAPFVVVLLAAGLAQPIAMAVLWFRRGDAEWTKAKWLAAGTCVWIYASFFLSVRGPLAHAFYVVFPVAALYAFHGFRRLAGPRLWRIAVVVLVSGVVVDAGVMAWQLPRRSLYRDRGLVQAAIDRRNDRLLGDRRESVAAPVDHEPRPMDGVSPDAYLHAAVLDDLVVTRAEWAPVVFGRVSRFLLTIEHRGEAAAYVDVRFTTTYRGADGAVIDRRTDGVIKEILEPGTTRAWPDLTDGLTPDGAVTATLTIDSAEKVIPLRPRYGEPGAAGNRNRISSADWPSRSTPGNAATYRSALPSASARRSTRTSRTPSAARRASAAGSRSARACRIAS